MSDPVIIGAEKTLEERIDAYNAERKALDEKYGFVLMADAYIENGLIRARPTLMPVEALPKPADAVALEHIHEAKATTDEVKSDVEVK